MLSSPSSESLPLWPFGRWLKKIRRETRTRILLVYAMTMLVMVAAAVPLFRYFLFSAVDERVRADLQEEFEEFQQSYREWNADSPETQAALLEFIEVYLEDDLPEDDNFHIVTFRGEFYQSNPRILPPALVNSELSQQWQTLQEAVEINVPTSDPEVGSVLYKTHVLEVDDEPVGVFIAAHLSAGERTEALEGVYLFAKIAVGVVGVSFLLAWLVSYQLLRPVQQLAKTAKDINETNLSERLEIHGSGELADLATTFNTMMDRVQTAFDTQRSFINDASHELRTPLTIIQGHLELMDDDPQERQATLALVMEELARMARFVNDLLLLTKAERPDFLQLETLDASVFMPKVFANIQTLGDRDWQLSDRWSGKFVADRQRLTGALVNLAQNAVQHTFPNDVIELGVERLNGQLRFWVRDTGEGISLADQTRVFDRFARVANTYRRSEGAGLGLAIVKTIAEAHGGHIELSSQVGVGSTFNLIVPIERLATVALPARKVR
ncbi:MAG: ATP-binding protein [Cyanobacteria bacterium P01_D01_bin.115]